METKMFIVLVTNRTNEERVEVKIFGVFDTIKKATEALDDAFCTWCDNLEIGELNNYSYYNEGVDFHIEDDDFISYANGEIVECNLNEINL